ncbi:hypothetical protein PV326_007620 [Microctonus aethiopoides]|nr:hypothetical protein PV326_007620 [Microctonus aethiopoides]
MRVLNVAEKNDAAKNIAILLSRGNSNKREGFSKFNKIYEFNLNLWNRNCTMIMTSVSGHLMGFDFVGSCRKWYGCHPLALFDAQVIKQCTDENYVKIKRTLEREVKGCDALIIWTDCDREGENIGFEIIQVCQAVKPNIQIYRAIFSEITQSSVTRAIQTLGQPNKAVSDAVDVRSELDLRIGAAFTRFQTLRLQKVFPQSLNNMLISYGSCQFPTLGFVVERFLAIEKFKSEPYWKLKVTDDHDNICVEFRWARFRLFEKINCQVFLDMCEENSDATVENVISKPKSKWRPTPLDTIELEKQGSRKLKLNAKETMKIAEKLYTQGFISYPRTETNIFPKELNLQRLVEQQINHPQWGEFAQRVLNDGISPRQGKKSDQAHPPIHPTKFADNLQGNEARVYEFIVRHFLACISKNAEGYETTVDINIAGEKFTANGLQIIAKNYLDVYIYEKWNSKEIHIYEPRQVFRPTSIAMIEENTSAPNLLTEADLIALMDKHGIGTDATHAEHIDTIKSRQYVGLKDGQYFMPGKLGIGLVMGYDNMGFQMSKPNLRAELESDLKLICSGEKSPEVVLQTQINNYRNVFKIAIERANLIDTALAEYIDERPSDVPEMEMIMPAEEVAIYKCPKCGLNMTLKERKQGGKFIGCMGFPTCNNTIWLPQAVTEIEVTNEVCTSCPGDMKKLKVKLRPGAFPLLGSTYVACIGGCDTMFNEMMNINIKTVRRVEQLPDSGYASSAQSDSQVASNSRSNTSNINRGSSTATRGGSSASTSSNNRGNSTATARGGSSSSTVGLMRLQNSRPSPMINNRGRRDGSNNASDKNRLSAKRQGDGWDSLDTEIKRPKITRPTTNNVDRENMNPVSSASNDDVYLCDCHERAIQLMVKKDGPNKGRLFYKCAKPPGSGCNFFLWSPDDATPASVIQSARLQTENNQTNTTYNWTNDNTNSGVSGSSNQRNPGPSLQNSRDDNNDEVACNCGQPAKKLTVRKDGPNKGRQFYACPQGPSSPCTFFQWADADSTSTNHGNQLSSSARGRGRGRGDSAPRGTTGARRKCGICGIEGHTKRTCPQNAMD